MLAHPVGKNRQFCRGPSGIVALHLDPEIVRAFHAGMHGEFHREIGLLTRLQCRRTDDNSGRSATL